MPDYKKMYFELYNAVTTAIDRLQNGQCDGENAYVENEDAPLTFPPDSAKEEKKAAE